MNLMNVIRNRAVLAAALFAASTLACFANQWTQYEGHPACDGWPCCCFDCGGYEACGKSGAWSEGQCAAWCVADCGVPSAQCEI